MSRDFKPSDFAGITLGKKLGAGTFGMVFVGLLRDGRYVAVKQLEVEEGAQAAEGSFNLDDNTEIEVHRRLDHPNIIRYLHSETVFRPGEPPKLHVYLEFVTGGSLTSIMQSLHTDAEPDARRGLPMPVVRVYSRHMFQGLSYLHRNGVAHRDVKGENLLVSQDTGIAKLADFDQAKVVAQTMTLRHGQAKTLAGTPFWIAPEVITQEDGYDPFRADVWSAGCTVAEMVSGKAPWSPMKNPMAIMYQIANSTGWPDAVITDKAILGDALYDFLDKCFQRDPATRPTAEECLAHPFLAEEEEDFHVA